MIFRGGLTDMPALKKPLAGTRRMLADALTEKKYRTTCVIQNPKTVIYQLWYIFSLMGAVKFFQN